MKCWEREKLLLARIKALRAGFAELIRAVEIQGGLVGYQSDVLDRAKAAMESANK